MPDRLVSKSKHFVAFIVLNEARFVDLVQNSDCQIQKLFPEVFQMRILLTLCVLFVASCSTSEPETYSASVNVDLSAIGALLTAIDQITEDDLDIDGLLAMTNSVPMDEEKQQRFPVSFEGDDIELMYHIWREQQDWVHVYVSSPSEGLIEAIEHSAATFARPEGS
jgi:hypothetical protein